MVLLEDMKLKGVKGWDVKEFSVVDVAVVVVEFLERDLLGLLYLVLESFKDFVWEWVSVKFFFHQFDEGGI